MEGIDNSKKSGFARWLPFIIPGVVIVLLLPVAIAIGLNNDEGRNDSITPEPSLVGATPAPGAVEVRNFEFVPNEITVRVGGNIRFQNTSQTAHKIYIGDLSNVPLTDGTEDDGYLLNGGETFEWTSEEVGTFTLICSLHENLMRGEVTVVEEDADLPLD